MVESHLEYVDTIIYWEFRIVYRKFEGIRCGNKNTKSGWVCDKVRVCKYLVSNILSVLIEGLLADASGERDTRYSAGLSARYTLVPTF